MSTIINDINLNRVICYVIGIILIITSLILFNMAYNTTNKTIPTEYEIIYDTVFNTNLNIIEIQEIIKNMNWEEKIKEMDENGYIEDIGHKRFYIMLGMLCMIPGIALLGFIIYIDLIYIPYKVDNL